MKSFSRNLSCQLHKINDQHCDAVNFHENCYHDGTDCCPNVAKIGDSFCNPENDIKACNYDGGDCCLTEQIDDGFCDAENFHRMCQFDGKDCYCEFSLVQNGICDLVNNKAFCDYDGGDCCDFNKIEDGLCYRFNNNPKCHHDGGDCCEANTHNWGNDFCDDELNVGACIYDMGDCCGHDSHGNGNNGNSSLILDGVCQEVNNNPACFYDGGDCHLNNVQLTLENCSNPELIGNDVCEAENYNIACNFDGNDCCTMLYFVGDGICNEENDIPMCNYDGGDCCKSGHIGNGICDNENNNRICNYDGGDCCDKNFDILGDGICNDENNIPQCSYDGGDCCLKHVNTIYCTNCECITQEVIQPFDPCPLFAKIGDGICQDENNNLICSYDGGDCCGKDIDTSNCTLCHKCLKYQEMPKTSYEGLCPNHVQIGDGFCQDENNIDVCLFDGGDCCLEELETAHCKGCICINAKDHFDPCPEGERIGDGACNLSNNNTVCSFDGGDCSR